MDLFHGISYEKFYIVTILILIPEIYPTKFL